MFVTARSNYPLTVPEIYELCFQDDCLSYFDVCTAVPEMTETGHLEEIEKGRYQITEKGKDACAITEDSVAITVRKRAEEAVERYNRQIQRSSFVKSHIVPRENGECSVVMSLDDEMGNLMTLELMAPNQKQGYRLRKLFEKKAESVYKMVMTVLLDEGLEDMEDEESIFGSCR